VHVPPFLAGVLTVRVCVCVPVVPHAVAEQLPEFVQALSVQLTGVATGAGTGTEQADALHGTVCVKGGHAIPPFAAGVVIVRLWVFVPVVPHTVAEQLPESDQPETIQSTGGHTGALHGTV